MKMRHLVLGFGLVLVLSLTVPALGSPLGLRPSSSAKVNAMAKKALKLATSAQQLAGTAQNTASSAQTEAGAAKAAANSAQTTGAAAKAAASSAQTEAGAAKAAANSAQTEAGAAKAAASGAQTTAAAAQSAASGAQTTANAAQTKADAVGVTANSAATTAQQALNAANGKFGEVVQVSSEGTGISDGNNAKHAVVDCPSGTTLAGGGFRILSGAAEPHISEPFNNGWFISAQSGGNIFNLQAFAMCLEH